MKQIFYAFYKALSGHEKKTFWFGCITFAIGFVMLIEALIPPSWRGWQETEGQLIGSENVQRGLFSGSSTTFFIQYSPENGEILKGTFRVSPVILSTMHTIRVFYQKNEPTVFYVHNPTQLVIALTMTVFGTGVLLTFFLYNRDRLKGITYD